MPSISVTKSLRLPPDEAERWDQAADRDGLTLIAYVRAAIALYEKERSK